MISRGIGTYVDMETCPLHILGQGHENVLYLNVSPYCLMLSPPSSRHNLTCPHYLQISSNVPDQGLRIVP